MSSGGSAPCDGKLTTQIGPQGPLVNLSSVEFVTCYHHLPKASKAKPYKNTTITIHQFHIICNCSYCSCWQHCSKHWIQKNPIIHFHGNEKPCCVLMYTRYIDDIDMRKYTFVVGIFVVDTNELCFYKV